MLKKIHKQRFLYGFLVLASIGIGLLSRSSLIVLPSFFVLYAGDTIWAIMVFFAFCSIFPGKKTIQNMAAALLFSFGIEFLQLYQAVWINEIRHTRLGGLVLGFGFQWSDLVCYIVGVFSAGGIDFLFLKSTFTKTKLS